MSNQKPNLDELNLSQEILDLHAAQMKALKIGEGAQIAGTKETVPSLLSPEDYKTVVAAQKITKDFLAATALTMSELSVAHMKKNKDVNTTELVLPYGDDKIEATFDRSKTYPGQGKDAEPVVKHGVLSMSYTASGAVNQRGAIKKIRGFANALASAELSK